MIDDTTYRPGDNDNNILRKILGVLRGAGGGTGPSSAVSIANGADVAEGATSDATASDFTSPWSAISLLKALFVQTAAQGAQLNTVNANLVTNRQVGGFTNVVQITPTISTSAYTAGDAVGGKQTIANAVRTPGTAILDSISITDISNQKAALEILIFNADPSATTITDNAALAINSADITKIIARISIASGDYVAIGTLAVATVKGLGIALKAASGTTLYAAVMTTGTPTYAGTSDLTFSHGFLQD